MRSLAALLLALGMAQARAEESPAQHQKRIVVSIEHWALLARMDSQDPETLDLAKQLSALRVRAAAPLQAPAVESLQLDFNAWKNRFTALCFERRLNNAPSDPAAFRGQLETGIVGVASLSEALLNRSRAASNVKALENLVDPAQFEWVLERRKDRAGALGLDTSSPTRRPLAQTKQLPGEPASSKARSSDHSVPKPPTPPQDQTLLSRLSAWGRGIKRESGHRCYSGFADILENLGIVSTFGNHEDEISAAFQFTRWVRRHPELQNRKIRRVRKPLWPLQKSNIVVWTPGVCGYSPGAGHIEILYADNPARAVSDFSGSFQVACFKEAAASSRKAEERLAALEQQQAKARELLDQAKQTHDISGARQARARIASLSRAIDEVDRYEMKVHVYEIDRPAIVALK